jgi:putative transcriptional regulator
MIRCHLSRLMGERRVRLVEVARDVGINRNMLAKLYYDRARRVDVGDLEKLCRYFKCSVGEFLELVPDEPTSSKRAKAGSFSPRGRKGSSES